MRSDSWVEGAGLGEPGAGLGEPGAVVRPVLPGLP